MICNINRHFSDKQQVRIKQSFFAQANESNFKKIDIWCILHANGNTKISSVETSVAKELALVILRL